MLEQYHSDWKKYIKKKADSYHNNQYFELGS